MINLPFFFLFIYLIYLPHNSMDLFPPTRSWIFLSLSYFSSWSPVSVFLPPFFFLKEVSLMFPRCFSLSLLSLPFLSLVSSWLFYQQLSCLCKGQSLPICLTRLSDTHAHTCTRTLTHRLFVVSLLHLFYLSCWASLFSCTVQTQRLRAPSHVQH